jgi:hypothetical protein
MVCQHEQELGLNIAITACCCVQGAAGQRGSTEPLWLSLQPPATRVARWMAAGQQLQQPMMWRPLPSSVWSVQPLLQPHS